jgi:glutathione S-transferase
MTQPILYAHPFSSYCQKALIALYEKGLAFDYRLLSEEHPEHGSALFARWPIGKMPLLIAADGRAWPEASIIVEQIDLIAPGDEPLIPRDDPQAALSVRLLDRIFDNYVMSPMQAIVADYIRPESERDRQTVLQARALLDRAYDWLEVELSGRRWAAGDAFTLADCAAAPSLLYADWVHPFGERRPTLAAYRARLLAWPSIARCVEEARPYRPIFPPGAPDRD